MQSLRVLKKSCSGAGSAVFCAAMYTDAITTARRYYTWAGRDLAADACALAGNPRGVFMYTPQLVVLMKPVSSRHPQDWEQLGHSPQQADAWYVHLLAGNFALALQLAHTLPPYTWVCFQRGRRSTRLHRLPWARILSQHINNNQHSKHTMGFAVKTPKAPAVNTVPPVVAETQETDAQTDYEQKSARRRGLLSTILTHNGKQGSLAPAAPTAHNSTLG